ncbi:uncharacterized protein Fot_20226 [Forsythia ovata]|uniref:Uncharacterized protein n=1 Tax=Forsythia ovata TaxID=205694 RepID=A0ABD1VR59_9LAMI
MELSCSPQSTLCSVIGWCECNQRFDCGTAHCISCFSSPSSANLKDGAAWYLLYAAAEKTARMRMIQVANKFYRAGGVLVPPRKPGPVRAPLKTPNYGPGISANQSHLSPSQAKVYRPVGSTSWLIRQASDLAHGLIGLEIRLDGSRNSKNGNYSGGPNGRRIEIDGNPS